MSKTYVKQWKHAGSIIRQRRNGFQVETNLDGKRRRHTEKSLAAAKAYAERKRVEVKNRGTVAVALDSRQTRDALDALHLLTSEIDEQSLRRPRATPLAEAARFWLTHNRPRGGTVSVQSLLSDFLEQKLKLNRRPTTIRELENKIGRFAKDLDGRQVHTVTATEIEAWLDANTTTASTRNKYKRLLHGFFRFAKRKGYLEQNPVADIESAIEDERQTEIYSVPQVESMLNAAQATAPDTVPVLAIGLFAGLRPGEIAGLDWADVNLAQRHILVRPETAKKRRRRLVTISDNLLAWLSPLHKVEGPISPPDITLRRGRAKILKAAEIARWIPDGLRHSFGSYHVAMHQDAGKTAFEMGHLNTAILYNHYRDLVSKQEAEKYWAIMPQVTSRQEPRQSLSSGRA